MKRCPLQGLKEICLEGACAWWDNQNQCCALLMIAKAVWRY